MSTATDKNAALAPAALRSAIMRKCRESISTKEKFFTEDADRIGECCAAMARAFDQGGRLFVMGNGGSSCDAAHVSVEFMHPIIEKRPAMPAMALTTDTAMLTAVGNDQDFSLAFTQQAENAWPQGRHGARHLHERQVGQRESALQAARESGLLTIGFSGRDGGRMPDVCDYCFTVPSFTIHRIQETHETLLHVLWDLIHVLRGEEDVI